MSQDVVVEGLLAHQRAELVRAEQLRVVSLLLQLSVALAAATSVFSSDGAHLLVLAGLGAVLLVLWLIADFYYRGHRAAGDQARRLLLLTSGLGLEVGELANLLTCFSAPVDRQSRTTIDDYFASRAPHGCRRLAEMLDESAFFTADLQRRSGELTALGTLLGGVGVFALFLLAAPGMNGSGRVTVARVFLAFVVFFLSSDVLGAAFAHLRAGSAMENIRLRLSASRGRNYPEGDVLQAMADYNAAVEGAPLPLPSLYRRRLTLLDATWAEYKQATGVGSQQTGT